MRRIWIIPAFAFGMAVGVLGVGAVELYRSFDQSISLLYLIKTLNDLECEIEVLQRMASADWVGMMANEARASFAELELQDRVSFNGGPYPGMPSVVLDNGEVTAIESRCSEDRHFCCRIEEAN